MSKRRSSAGRLMGLLAPHWKLLIVCALCVLAVNASELLKPWVMEKLIDDFIVQRDAPSGLHSIEGLSAMYFGAILLGALASLFQTRLLNRVGQSILHGVRVKLFSRVHRMTLAALDRYGTGRLITRITNDIEALNEFYSDVLVNLFRDVFLLVGIVAVMLNMDPGLALVGFVSIPMILVVTLLVRKALRRNFVQMKSLIGRINGFIAENIAGMRIVQAFNRQREKFAEFHTMNERYFKSTMFQVLMNSVLRPVMEIINSLVIALLILYGYNRISGGLLEIGVLYAFTTYIKQFFEPINDLAEKYNSIQSSLVSADRIYELMEDPEPPEDLDEGIHGGEVKGHVEFRDVWFAYECEDWVLRGVSFAIRPGEKAAFVGATGAGKSTIINLLSGFYIPQRGQILVDGVPIADWKLKDLRRGVSVVLQDVVLFSGTIADNIRISADLDDDDVVEALRQSMALEFVMEQPGQLHADVTERGSTFSSGERQLLSFARAIAHKPAILVLDEATASIDTETERMIQQSLMQITEGRTAIFIAHRLSTIRCCDWIFVIDGGSVVERGSHAELMELDGLYCRLCAAPEQAAGRSA